MSMAQVQTATDSFKEVTNRTPQPGLEAVYLQAPGVTYAQRFPQPELQVLGTGKRKTMFWLYLAVGLLGAAVIGLAVGLGVGLSRQNEDSNTSSVSSTGDLDITSPAPSPTSFSSSGDDDPESTYTTTVTRTATSTSTPTPSSVCPSSNNTLVTQYPGSIRYRIYCDSDFDDSGKETLASIVLGSFDECLALCNTMNYFQDRTDVGCTYNVAGTGTQTPGTCWCLGGEGLTVVENVGNDAAMPV
ncbi:hypothetical protein BDV12DRAFT_170491 [Aspergillus spectabilis]